MLRQIYPHRIRLTRGNTIFPVLLCIAILIVWTGLADDGAPAPSESGELKTHTGPPCEEPQLPLQLSWRQLNSTGGMVSVSLVLHAEQELPSVRLEMVLPDGVGLIAGSDAFQGSVTEGGTHTIPFQFALEDDGPHRLEAHARGLTATGISFRRSTSISLGTEAETVEQERIGVLKETPDGLKRIREFPAREVR